MTAGSEERWGEEWPREGRKLLKINWLMAQPEVELHWLPSGFRLLYMASVWGEGAIPKMVESIFRQRR
jgi:hypothetical protein